MNISSIKPNSSMNRIKTSFLLVISVVFAVFLNSCNDLPTEVGSPLLYDTVMVTAVSSLDNPYITGQKIVDFHKGILNTYGILIGKYQGMESASFIRCGDLPEKDSLSYMTPDRIISSKFVLKAKRWAMGDSLAPLSFKAYEVKKLWTIKATWDSMFTAPADYIDYSKAVGKFSDQITLRDSVTDVTFDFDKELTAKWLKYGSDTANYINLGIALKPDENCNQIRRFAGQFIAQATDTVHYNELQVVYLNKENEQDTITLRSAMDFTLTNAPRPSDDLFVLQGNAQYATQLSFDLSTLPDNIAIHSAQLEVQLDLEKSLLSNYNSDSLRDPLISAVYLKNGADSIVVGDTLIPLLYGAIQSDFRTYKYSLFTYAIEYWLRYGMKKGQIILTKTPVEKQYVALDKYVFYGINDPDPKKRPRLKIIYSRRPSYVKDIQKGGN